MANMQGDGAPSTTQEGSAPPPTQTVIHNPETGEEFYLSADGQKWLPSTWSDIKKTAGPSLIRGAAQVVSAPKEVARLGGQVLDWAAKKWLPEGSVDFLHSAGNVADKMMDYNPLYQALKAAPDYKTTIDKVQEHTGPLYEAQTTGGKYAQSALEFIPGAVAGPGGLLRNTGKAVASGLASEALGQATADGPLEPYARAAGAVGGSALRIPGLGKKLPPEQVFKDALPQQHLLYGPKNPELWNDLQQVRNDYLKSQGLAGLPMPQGDVVQATMDRLLWGPSGPLTKAGKPRAPVIGMSPDWYTAQREDMANNARQLRTNSPRQAVAINNIRNALDQHMGRHILSTNPGAYKEWEQARQAMTPNVKPPSPMSDALWNLGGAFAGAYLGPAKETATSFIAGHMATPEVRQMVQALGKVAPHVTQFDPKLTARILATQGPMNAPLQQTPEGYPYIQAGGGQSPK